ncbi:MAG: hypothetical protein P4L81_05975 [Candidatus Pacebacteria bacterium]|nr:hypothetical protein [Candidatus Paceibacterota bacterium]
MIDVKGSIGTFDFKNMHQHNNESDSYKEIQKYSQKKLFKYIRTKSSIGSDGIEDGSVPTQAELLKKIGEAIRILKEDRELSILAQRTTVIAHCLKNYADADEEDFDVVINKLSFRVVGGEVRIFEPSLHSQSGQQTHATAWNIKSTESSRQITGLMIPTFPELESSGVKYYLILHRHILGSPDGPVYTFTTQYLVHGSMRGLATTRSDYITQKNTTEWPAEVFEFVLLLPSEFQKSVKPFLRAGNAHLRSLEIPLSELVSDPLLSMPAYTPVGLRAFDVPPETRVGVDFKVVG